MPQQHALAIDVPDCPECGAAMYDNRAENAQKNDGRRRPDFRCKEDRDHVIWPPREKKGGGKGGAKNAGQKQGFAVGRIPEMDDEGDVPAAPVPTPPSVLSPENLAAADKARTERICKHMTTAIRYFGDKEKGALKLMDELGMPYTPTTAQALATSLFIALCDAKIR